MRKQRILIAVDHLGYEQQIHGITTLLRYWSAYLDPERFDVSVCVLRRQDRLVRFLAERGVKVIVLDRHKFNPVGALAFVNLVRHDKIDLVHAQEYRAITYGRLARFLAGVPLLVHFHDTDPNYPVIQRWADRLLGSFTDGYLAVSNSVRNFWASRCKLDPEQINVLYNCVSVDEFDGASERGLAEEKQRWDIPPGSPVVGSVTRLFEGKGTEYLLQAAPAILRRHPDTVFVIAGDGPMKTKLKDFANALQIQEHVRFTGFVERVASLVAMFDISVTTSYCEGGSPLPVVEAMAMGKPVIATNIVETVEDGISGILVPPRDANAIAENVLRLLEDRPRARSLAANGRRLARHYDAVRYTERLGALYDRVQESAVTSSRPLETNIVKDRS